MVSGVVMSNNQRRLDPKEFRGFALSDPLAPLVFVNGADTKAAQTFTLAHELGHLWLGKSALSNMDPARRSVFRREEVWCNAVAAELLVPHAALRPKQGVDDKIQDLANRLAREFKVSALVVLRRLFDAGRIDRAQFEMAWEREIQSLRGQERRKNAGGDFHLTTLACVGRRFAWALVTSTLEGHTLYRNAFRMLGISRADTFDRLGRELGVTGCSVIFWTRTCSFRPSRSITAWISVPHSGIGLSFKIGKGKSPVSIMCLMRCESSATNSRHEQRNGATPFSWRRTSPSRKRFKESAHG